MCHTIQEGILANALYFLSIEEREAKESLRDCSCNGWCVSCILDDDILREIQILKVRPFHSWGRRSWVYLARKSHYFLDRANSGLAAFYFRFSWLLWLASQDAVGCIPGDKEEILRESFSKVDDAVRFCWGAAPWPYSRDYEAARASALWMQGR